MTAREQAREAWEHTYAYDANLEDCIDAASDVWEKVVREILEIATTGKVCPSDAKVIERVLEALGED